MGTFKSIRAATAGFPQRFGDYQLLAKLATGGMGEVFLARRRDAREGFEKLVVLKRVLPHLMDQPRFVKMFQHEARIAARINHTNVCQTFELGSTEGMYYMTMEYMEGVPLNHVIQRRKNDRRLGDLRLVGRFLVQAAEGLHAAHELRDDDGELVGVVHRDVCHSNIFVTSAGVAKLLDFGVAKARGAMEKTRTGTVKGTYAYSAPEQLRGESVDRRADVFGLGIVAWEAVAGRRLFRRDTDFLVFKAITEEPIPSVLEARPEAVPELARVIERALSRDAGDRFETAREFGMAIGAAVGSLGPPSSSVATAALIEEAFAAEFRVQRELCGMVVDETETETTVDRDTTADRQSVPTITTQFEPREKTPFDRAMPLLADTEELPALFADGFDDGFDGDLPDFEVTPVNAGMSYSGLTPMPQRAASQPSAPGEPAAPASARAQTTREPADDADVVDLLTPPVPSLRPSRRRELLIALALACAAAFGAIAYLLLRGGGQVPAGEAASAPEPGRRSTPAVAASSPGPDAAAAVAVATPVPPDAAPELRAELGPAQIVENAPEDAGHPDEVRKRDKTRATRRTRKTRKTRKVAKRAAAKPGYLTVDAKPYATVWIDGKKAGVTPVVHVELSAGRHSVRAVSSTDGRVKRFKIKVASGKSTRKKITW